MKIVALAGGVGGAKLAHGFSRILSSKQFTVIVNTGDDFTHFGLSISPDIDTVCYTLADLSNPATGWGRAEETSNVFRALENFGAPDWFFLGDKDIALHLERTRLLREGLSLTEVTAVLSHKLEIEHPILPMSDQVVRTMVKTSELGVIPFQEYFVKHRFALKTENFIFAGIEKAKPSVEVLSSLKEADMVVICPSNPFVSIDPILRLPGVRDLIRTKFVVAVSPIINEKAVKGPLGQMLRDQDLPVHPISVMKMYRDFLNVFIIDSRDNILLNDRWASSIMILKENILLKDIEIKIQLARTIINLYKEIN